MSDWEAKTIADTLTKDDLIRLYYDYWTGTQQDFSVLYKINKHYLARYLNRSGKWSNKSNELEDAQQIKITRALKVWANEFSDSFIRKFKMKGIMKVFKDDDSITGGIFLYDF